LNPADLQIDARLEQALNQAAHFLQEAGADAPRLTAEVLLAQACGLEREELLKKLILCPSTLLDKAWLPRLQDFLVRRARGEPTAYITGRKEFYGRDFSVAPATLIPRPESELLIDLALKEAAHLDGNRPEARIFADFGTGSGCLAATLSLELGGNWRGLALDKSAAALRLAAANCRALGCAPDRLLFIRGNFYFAPIAGHSLDLLLCNPPYISAEEYFGLAREIRDFEPKSALVPEGSAPRRESCPNQPAAGTEDALCLIRLAQTLLRPGGILLLEMGSGQGKALLRAASQNTWSGLCVHKDAAGLDRVLFGKTHCAEKTQSQGQIPLNKICNIS
jgi:release factor glutamine methyltransferase